MAKTVTLTEAVTEDPVKAGIEVASEFTLPLAGGSNLVKGDFGQALIHAGLAVAAKSLFGTIGVVLVSANSLSVALTGNSLMESLKVQGTEVASSHAGKSAK